MSIKKPSKNIFDLFQFKKMIGKQLILPCAAVVIDKKKVLEDTKKFKESIFAAARVKQKKTNIVITGFVVNGIVYIISGFERYYAIQSITYGDLKTAKGMENVEVHLFQYPKLTRVELNALIRGS